MNHHRRPPIRHELKCWIQPFSELALGLKKSDLRRCDDRDFMRGDELLEREYSASTGRYSGRALLARITHITRYAGELGLEGTTTDEERGTAIRLPLAVLSVEVLEVGTYKALTATAVLP